MKKEFFDIMLKIMDENPDVYFILMGLGYPRIDEFLAKYPDRVINTEASEQTAMDIAVGLAYAGKYPVTYTITPFYYRAFETLRTYVDHEQLPMCLIGAGRNDDYSKHDGYSHDATDIFPILSNLRNINQFYPDKRDQLKTAMEEVIEKRLVAFINIRR